ncbi:substrate-binding periplasmic protein [Xanthocytophaga flava]|uniref:substrate-binding periplasmic protein n=1 Tax=Xanthocytophaga flava TaxID=3048013 RepID=UPI0028D04993|nr:transporter substrate-binding domain-containing protein [Xanthocytophaga flavus]MDJ1467709.1 transporter substrate-binding domain-containing protein [Xanthocytophaga flavus]
MKSVLHVGLDHAAPVPLHTDIRSGQFEGFEVDLLQCIAQKLNCHLEYKIILWKDILEKLEQKEVDIVCSAVTVTESRKKVLGFTNSYLDFHLGVVSRKDGLLDSIEKLSQKKAGVRIATEAEDYIRQYLNPFSVYTSDSNDDLYTQLQEGAFDYLVDDTSIAGAFVEKHPILSVSLILPDTESSYAIALQKDNHSLRNTINTILDELKQNGTYDMMYQRWFQNILL